MAIEITPRVLKRRRTKIVATLGPASSSPGTIDELIAAGVDVFRLNFSHGKAVEHWQACAAVRRAAETAGEPVALLADLCGPKIRVGRFADGSIEVEDGEEVTIALSDELGGRRRIPMPLPSLTRDLEVGQRILLDDGRLEFVVHRVGKDDVTCEVVRGGVLGDCKGANFPDTALSVRSMTDKDRRDASLAMELGVDYLALSFVRAADDVVALRRHLGDGADAVRIVAKIEKPEALVNIDAILDVSDAIMVARGDLGVEMPPETVPGVQDELVAACRVRHKPVIIATQMLESMIHNARPTRAEVADVAHAVGSGTDAVMLSGETAVGKYPVDAVGIMDRVIRQTEALQWSGSAFRELSGEEGSGALRPTNEAVGRAVSQLSRDLQVRAILVVSRTGTSGMIVSSCRPAAPLLAATPGERTQRQLNLFWGVVPIRVDPAELDEPVPMLRELVTRLELAEPDQNALIVQGFRTQESANEPSITVVRL